MKWNHNNGGERKRKKRAKGKKEVKYKKKKLLFNCTLCRVSPEGETTLKVNLFFSYHCCAGCVIITHLGTLCVYFSKVCSNSEPMETTARLSISAICFYLPPCKNRRPEKIQMTFQSEMSTSLNLFTCFFPSPPSNYLRMKVSKNSNIDLISSYSANLYLVLFSTWKWSWKKSRRYNPKKWGGESSPRRRIESWGGHWSWWAWWKWR